MNDFRSCPEKINPATFGIEFVTRNGWAPQLFCALPEGHAGAHQIPLADPFKFGRVARIEWIDAFPNGPEATE